MSDEEANFVGGSAPPDDELSLPRATVQKLISGERMQLWLHHRCMVELPFLRNLIWG